MAQLQQADKAHGVGMGPLVVALLAALVLAILATTTPSPQPAGIADSQFSAGRAMADVRTIAGGAHPAGSVEDAQVVRWLVMRLNGLGMIARAEPFVPDISTLKRELPPEWPAPHAMANVIAVLPGRDRTLPAVALMAHHDSVAGSPAAADDGTGVAAIIETVRALAAGPRPLRDIVVIVTDGEELGLFGARHAFQGSPPPVEPVRDHIGALINLEARGGGGRAALFQTGAANGEAVAFAARVLQQPTASSLAVYLYRQMPNDTDLTMALPWADRRGVAAYNFAFIGRPGLYHSPRATPDRLDQGSLQHMGSETLSLTRALANAPALPGPAPDVVFFDLFGLTVVTMPLWAGWVLLAAALAGIVPLFRQGDKPVRAALGGAARMGGLVLAAGVWVMLANRLSLHPGGWNYYDRLAANPRLEMMAGFAAIAAFAAVLGGWRAKGPALAGALLPLWIAGAVFQALAPMAAYVVILPVALAVLIAHLAPRSPWLAAGVAAPVIGYQLGLGHQLFQAVGGDLPAMIALPLVLATLAVLPLWQPMTPRLRWIVAGAALVAMLATALIIRTAPMADTVPAYSLHKSRAV